MNSTPILDRDMHCMRARTPMLDWAQTYYAQHEGMFCRSTTQLRRSLERVTGANFYDAFEDVSEFEAVYLTHRSGLPVTEQKALARQRGCLAAWLRAQLAATKFDVRE